MRNWSDYYPRLKIADFWQRFPFPSRISEMVVKYAKPGERILEAGIGTAVDSIYLSHLDYQVFGIDKEALIITNARGLNEDLQGRANFVQMDAFRLGFKDNSFGVVFHDGMIEHYNRQEIIDILKEQLRVSRFVILGVPTSRYTLRTTGVYLKGIFGNENFLSYKQWKRILSVFKIIEVDGTNVLQPKYKRLLRNIMYLPFWVVNERIWSQRYLPFYQQLFFTITNK